MNSPSQTQANPANVGRIAQIIVGALIAGLLSFCIVAFAIQAQQAQANGQTLLTMIGAGMAGIHMLLWAFMPASMVRSQLKDLGTANESEQQARLAHAYLTKKIVAAALLEGAGIFNCVVYGIERQTIALIVIGAVFGLLLVMFPSQMQFETWAEDMKRALQ